MFLSKAERDFLLSAGSSLQISDGYSRVIKSTSKKIERFASEALPLLIDKGFIQSTIYDADAVTEFRNGSVTKSCSDVEGEGNHDYDGRFE